VYATSESFLLKVALQRKLSAMSQALELNVKLNTSAYLAVNISAETNKLCNLFVRRKLGKT